MSDIKTFPFTKEGFTEFGELEHGRNWPVVYLIEDGKEMYIGETTNIHNRSNNHFKKEDRRKLPRIHVISDDEYNKSATLDTESLLIQYIFADDVFKLQNANTGLQNHNYFDKQKYVSKFESLWDNLKSLSLVKKDLVQLKNSDIFKYSPYKTLTDDQLSVVSEITKQIIIGSNKTFLVTGKPGTGKTILAIYLVKALADNEKTKHLKVGLVVPMTSLRGTVKKVLSKIKGLKSSVVIGPSDVVKNQYDILIVDEAHRLKQRKNITNYKSHDDVNIKLGLDKQATELDWVIESSKHQIFLYDPNQSVRPSDVHQDLFKNMNTFRYDLRTQVRVEGGESYINFIDKLFDLQKVSMQNFENYDFKVYDSISKMIEDIKEKDNLVGLSRMVSGYAWPWISKENKSLFDIEIDNVKLMWNSTNQDWVNSPNAINEVGCIHTVQGYDLNYVGVIIGPELSYDADKKCFIIKKENYYDSNGWRGIENPKELERYIINIYKTLLTRGIKGCYVYFVDKEVEKYFRIQLGINSSLSKPVIKEKIISPYAKEMVLIPLVGSAPCGEPILGENNIEEMIQVDKSKIRPGVQYFILRAIGDSMNLAGINDGDLVLCRYSEKGETGDRVVALLGGENVTIKSYDKKDGLRILLPKSTNKSHKPIIPEEGDVVQGVVQEVIIQEDEL